MKALAAIVDLNQRTLAFKAEGLGAFFRHCSIPCFSQGRDERGVSRS